MLDREALTESVRFNKQKLVCVDGFYGTAIQYRTLQSYIGKSKLDID